MAYAAPIRFLSNPPPFSFTREWSFSNQIFELDFQNPFPHFFLPNYGACYRSLERALQHSFPTLSISIAATAPKGTMSYRTWENFHPSICLYIHVLQMLWRALGRLWRASWDLQRRKRERVRRGLKEWLSSLQGSWESIKGSRILFWGSKGLHFRRMPLLTSNNS